MKSNVVFSIRENQIIFLQVSAGAKRLVTGVEVIDIDSKSDVQISQALGDLKSRRKMNFKESRVTVLLPRSRAILRHMVFPSQNPEEVRSMVDLQVGGRIPFAREEVEIDFQILSKTPDGYAKAAVVIIPQETAMRFWNIFAEAQIPVQGMTVSSVGLWSLYRQMPGAGDGLGAMVDLDDDHSEVCLCAKTHWLTSREIAVGFKRMEQDGCAEFLRQWDLTCQAEKLSTIHGPVFLASSTDRAFEAGGELVQAQNDLTLKEIHMTNIFSLAGGVKWPKAIMEDGVSIVPLAGIALSVEAPPIDLTPRSVRQAQRQRSWRRQWTILGIWGGIALVSLGLALSMGSIRKNAQLAALQGQLHKAQYDALKVKKRLQEIDDIEGMVKGRLIFADLVAEISRVLPPDVYLVDLTISDGKILTVEGVSSNPGQITQFQSTMAGSRAFTDINLNYVNKRATPQGEADYFKITCGLVKGKNET